LKTEDFNYYLPEDLIAQTPIIKRDESRMMVLDRQSNTIEHKKFKDIIDYLNKDDILVLNDTKVMPSRLIGIKEETNASIEVFLIEEKEKDVFIALVKPGRRVKIGTIINFDNIIKATCIDVLEEGLRLFKLQYSGSLFDIMDKIGQMPTPPYIHEKLKDNNRYQTVYASRIGSVAAPTAGLHFTDELLCKLKDKGINICYVTLHVGLGTFKPVTIENVEEHKMHSEYYSMTKETADILNFAKEKGNKIISVGTTTTRTLETIIKDNNCFCECSGYTNIFIYPGYKFKAIDSLITNFHLPKSTLLMLVSAFYNKESILNAYSEAVKDKYRFFSFGDCMFIK
jgi:S-adenosylmethionine:tRNA ribosyltransferase-isomerase